MPDLFPAETAAVATLRLGLISSATRSIALGANRSLLDGVVILSDEGGLPPLVLRCSSGREAF